MEHKFRASVKPSFGYGIAVSVVDLPSIGNCDIHLFHVAGNIAAATILNSSELDALILALQGARAMLQPTK